MGMRNDDQKPPLEGGVVPRSGRGKHGVFPSSFRALSKIVSSGASTVASTVKSAASAASAIVERDNESSHDQVLWAGFDKLECERGTTRQILLLGCRYGFQVWDVEDGDNVCNLVSRHDGPVSFVQVLPKLIASKIPDDKFSVSRPMLILCADGSFSGGSNSGEGIGTPHNGTFQHYHNQASATFLPTVVWFYSLRSHSYVHQLKFRSVVHLVRCSSRVIAILQAAQIHCFDAATLEREYTIVTNPVVTGFPAPGNIGVGPLAVGPRWIAYSGSPVSVSNSGRVNPQHLTPSASFPSPAPNGSLVAHYAKESSKQLAAGLVTLGDIGYKKLSRYYSELRPDGNSSQSGNARVKVPGAANGHFPDADSVGMVIVRDIVSKALVAQFRAHKSPISALCFDPSTTLLVTASVQGHNINVFRIVPGLSGSSYVHLYTLQRGLTNAVIQDISFSSDSRWIMISSSRGTSHLFAISPSGGSVDFHTADACFSACTNGSGVMTKPSAPRSMNSQVLNQQSICGSGPPVALSTVGRIRSGANGWKNTLSGAAAAATGNFSSLSGSIASAFQYYKNYNQYTDAAFLKSNYHLLVFSSPGCVIQYALRMCSGLDSVMTIPAVATTFESGIEVDTRLVIDAIQKWNIFQKQNRKERGGNIDIYGEVGDSDSSKVFPESIKVENGLYSKTRNTITEEKRSSDERHHMYISEVELEMHKPQIPLWAKPEIYFQSFVTDGINVGDVCAFGGESEIEAIPTHLVEARSKDLIPVFDYIQASKTQQGRACVNGDHSQQSLPRLEVSGNCNLMANGGYGSRHSMNGPRSEVHCGQEVTGLDGIPMTGQTANGFVNSSESPKADSRLAFVNSMESSVKETQSKFVNNNLNGTEMENHFEDEVDDVD
ncbi:PREDICTED: autophagy-related protein 18f-like [Nicotiana attenuata]|uniref:Autophagy-related protein 18f n=1 Tax=Nicotiana attenuata TaxID=49451 RepID=A0A1J6KFP6_NICAT|nr:PREDICTED: autophagy-related protein 18f-like [Nicotiana attenuata]OIT28230.1 autophagy-related protein 18f [Nicotiana attenuata]